MIGLETCCLKVTTSPTVAGTESDRVGRCCQKVSNVHADLSPASSKRCVCDRISGCRLQTEQDCGGSRSGILHRMKRRQKECRRIGSSECTSESERTRAKKGAKKKLCTCARKHKHTHTYTHKENKDMKRKTKSSRLIDYYDLKMCVPPSPHCIIAIRTHTHTHARTRTHTKVRKEEREGILTLDEV